MTKIKTRFAPSPTGFLHSGNYRTAVFSYLFARQSGGEFVLRIEDTDKVRSEKKYEDSILESLKWLGIDWDDLSRQSERSETHKELLHKLVDKGLAYVSKEEVKKEGDRSEVIRFKNPGGVVSFVDVIRGEVSMEVDDLGDFIIAKSFDEPVFHFAVVVDDFDSEITHVIRGEDHISNTPRQILIQRALGFSTPKYAHLPLILSSDRTKLSKRKGALPLMEYKNMGFLPEAMLNYLAFLGWNPGDEREYLSRENLMNEFLLEKVHKAGAIFDETKLLSVNQHWMRKLSDSDYLSRGGLSALNPERLNKIVPLLKERAHTFVEAREMLTGDLACIFQPITLELSELISKEPGDSQGVTTKHLTEVLKIIENIPDDTDDFHADNIKSLIMPWRWPSLTMPLTNR